jgi:hypothetical protein
MPKKTDLAAARSIEFGDQALPVRDPSNMHPRLVTAVMLTAAVALLVLMPTTRALAAGLYPWNDPHWRYRLYGFPYNYPYYYRTVCGVEREPYGLGKKIRWRRVFRCH